MNDGMNDGRCAYEGCQKEVDWKKHDKPPQGWATVSITRYGKKGGVGHKTLLVCPDHTIKIAKRQLGLALPETEKEPSIQDRQVGPAEHLHADETKEKRSR